MDPDLASPRDVVVIGAGPAGAMSAFLLARAGVRTLLVERKAFPRPKVCGGCLNAHAVAELKAVGLDDRVRSAGATPVSAIALHHGGRVVTLELPKGLAVSRATLDRVLVDAAIEAGCEFVSETIALVSPEGPTHWREQWRRLTLQHRHDKPVVTAARVVVVADGLSHSSLRECAEFRSRVWSSARIGIGTLVGHEAMTTSAHTISMAVGSAGYVGAVQVEGGFLNVAAAVDAEVLTTARGAGPAVAGILVSAGLLPGPSLVEAEWLGTVPLTRSMRRPVARRVLVLGDAAGYVEPFTGEGMAWALTAARAAVPFVREGLGIWTDGLERRWLAEYRRVVGHEQRWCRSLARMLRHSWTTRASLAALGHYPGLARPLLSHLSGGRTRSRSGAHVR